MKKYICIVLSLLLCLGFLCACEEEKSNISDTSVQSEASDVSSLPEESLIPEESTVPDDSSAPEENSAVLQELQPPSDDTVAVEFSEVVSVGGKVIEKWTNALTINPYISWDGVLGDTVYVMTDDAEEWCIGDEVEVFFSRVLTPEGEYERIIAKDITSYYEVVYEKPIIYLYPQVPTVCSVKLTLNGALTCTYPDYGKGWDNFIAYPDGTLIFPDGKEYYALYWEGVQRGDWDFSKGFCVRGEDTASFLEWALAAQGLTPREANEFIVYWLPRMQVNEYNVISFQTDAYTDGAVLDISPAPDSLLRVFMTYYASDAYVDIPPQEFASFIRQGFTVVEWGGSEVIKP